MKIPETTTAIYEFDGEVINVVMLDMAYGIYEEVHKNKDESFSIFLNSRYSNETLRHAFEHALDHIRRRDWDKTDVQEIEAEAHGIYVRHESDWIMDMIERLRERSRKNRKKYAQYDRKYEKMNLLDIMRHNEMMLDLYESEKGNPIN